MNAPRIALLYPGDRAQRERADPAESRFAALFATLRDAGVHAEPAVWHDDFAAEVRAQLLALDAVLVWCNPIEGGRRRDVLDTLLRDVAAAGVFVSAHPDTVLRLATKDILVATRGEPFGSATFRVDSPAALRAELPGRLAQGPRVLKQHRGHSGIGVWRVEAAADGTLRVQQAQRGSVEQRLDWAALEALLAPCFAPAAGGHLVDQPWQARLADGMWRAYVVGERVAGCGFQAVNALVPGTEPGPRLYFDADEPRFAPLRNRLEGGWIRRLAACAGVAAADLPLLWDCDFLFGGAAGYVLCEVNASSVAPFPPSAVPALVQALRDRSRRVTSP